MNAFRRTAQVLVLLLTALLITPGMTDTVTDWNLEARKIAIQSGANTPVSNRIMAIVHTAMFSAANAVSQQYPGSDDYGVEPDPDASLDAAVAAAARDTLLALLPEQRSMIEASFRQALKGVSGKRARNSGLKVGQAAARRVLEHRTEDGHDSVESYRPVTTPGKYVPTTIPAVPQWPARKPWLLSSADQFMPGAPPSLDSEHWARDLNEVKRLGGADSAERTPEQTEIAKFWEATLPPIYHGVVHSVASQPGRSVTQNARLFAAVTRAIDDAMIAVFHGKYHFSFWRPVTAIRNADQDGNDATVRDETWRPFITTPMHPEYPCAHCVVAGTLGAVLKAEIGDDATPLLSTQSMTAGGTTRTWTSVDAFVEEVTLARIYDGVHYRFSGVAGSLMGQKIGEQAARVYLGNDLSSVTNPR